MQGLMKKGKIKITLKDSLGLLGPFIQSRLLEQIKSIWLIIVYLFFFQTIVLGIPVARGAAIVMGIGFVIGGLTLFMEGLVLGLMPLSERVGIRLPQRVGLFTIMGFAFLLGLLSTLAEPAIQVLQTAGKSVNAWEAPLLFMLLNQYAKALVLSVGGGVGLAVALGMVRFYYSWSLKPLIFILTSALILVTGWAYFIPNLRFITGLAWDCGAVTTGPVTVPLVLSLGIGISRMVGTTESGATGFGVVTLASLFPILTVFLLGIALLKTAPPPMNEAEFFSKENRNQVQALFESDDHMAAYALRVAGDEGRRAYFGETGEALSDIHKGNDEDLAHSNINDQSLFKKSLMISIKAIGLLTVPLFLIMIAVLREKLPHADEILLGLVLTVLGMCFFNIGIETGLDKLGRQVGSMLPASFRTIDLPGNHKTICPFSKDLLYTAVTPEGNTHAFFFSSEGKKVKTVPFKEENFDASSGCYRFKETKGPLFGREMSSWGVWVVLLFAFVMGFGATLAEPALNALGITVEELTVGTFRKSLLMRSVAIGVGIGLSVGVAKIVWEIPLAFLLLPPYVLLLFLTLISSEEFVNFAWDGAAVTTGPITVPLVLSVGIGIGSQVGVVEGFGLLASASVFPILSVLIVGLYINQVRKSVLEGEKKESDEGAAIHE